MRRVGIYEFEFIGHIRPAADGDGRIAEYTHVLPIGVKPNRYAGGPFCSFELDRTASGRGVYIITVGEDLRYVGECEDLAGRFGPTGHIG